LTSRGYRHLHLCTIASPPFSCVWEVIWGCRRKRVCVPSYTTWNSDPQVTYPKRGPKNQKARAEYPGALRCFRL
jgi:hypothetical protein